MQKFIRNSPVILFLISFPIGFFYSPNLPTYILGNLRESVGVWATVSFIISTSIGIAAFFNYREEGSSRSTSGVLFIITLLLCLLHVMPTLLYWDVLATDGIVRDDSANQVVRANIYIALWHFIILISSAIISLTTFFNAIMGEIVQSRQ